MSDSERFTISNIHVPKCPVMKHVNRLDKIIDGLRKGKHIMDIAEECGVTRRTIDRDLKKWEETGGFERWLNAEIFLMYDRVVQDDDNAVEALKILTSLKRRYIKQEMKVETEGALVLKWQNNEQSQSSTNPTPPSNSSTTAEGASAF